MQLTKVLTAAALVACCVATTEAFGGGRRGGRGSGSGSGGRRGKGGSGSGKGSGGRPSFYGNQTNTNATKYTLPAGWTTKASSRCTSRASRTVFKSFTDASTACKSSKNCTAIGDFGCRGAYFSLCAGGAKAITRAYSSCVVGKFGKPATTSKPTTTSKCDTKIIGKLCKNADIKIDLTQLSNRRTLCATPCSKYLVQNMNACSVAITKQTKTDPQTELYLANIDKYCSPHQGKGTRGSGKGSSRGSGKGSSRGSGKGTRGSGKGSSRGSGKGGQRSGNGSGKGGRTL